MKDQVINLKTENTQLIKTEDIKKEEKVKNEQMIIKQENEDVKPENITEQKNIRSENEDEQNVKVDVTSCSPTGYFSIKNLN